MRQLKNVFAILTLIFTALFIASCDGNGGDDKDSGTSGDSIVCTYYMKDDTSVYYVFYGDGSVEYYSKGELQYKRGVLRYKGNPKSEGIVDITVNTGTLLVTFKVYYVNEVLVPVELVPGFPVEYTLTLDGENDNSENSGTDKENTEGSGENGNGENDNTENVNTCKWVLDADHTIYFIFYPDNTVEYYSNGSLEYDRSTLNYEGTPTEAGTVTIKVNTGVPLFTFTVTKNGSSVTATENNMGLTYTMAGDSSNNGESGNGENGGPEEPSTDIDESPLMFMGFDNVVTIEKGTDITGITNAIYSLTSDTTLKFKGGINSITLTTIAAAIGTNDSVKIALDFSEATGITEWTNKLAGQKTLYAISLPSTVTSVQDGAFANCTNLKAITVPKTITKFPSVDSEIIVNLKMTLADWLNASMKISGAQPLYLNGEEVSGEVTVPDGITTIRSWAFSNCPNLTKIVLPESVTVIKSYAFSNYGSTIGESWNGSSSYICSAQALKSINLENVTSIKVGAFAKCNSLKEIHLSQIESVGGFAFYECSGLTNVTINGCSYGETSIGDYAFHNCRGLMEVSLGNSVAYIGDYAFSCYPENDEGWRSVSIPDSVSYIGKNAFSIPRGSLYISFGENTAERGEGWCKVACNIDISGSSIPSNAFLNCNEITGISINENVTSIGSRAFYGCSGLTAVGISGNITSIGEYAFSECSGLEALTIWEGDTPLKLENNAFSNSPLERIDLRRDIEFDDEPPFAAMPTLEQIHIEGNVTNIADGAFSGCTKLEYVDIFGNVSSIGEKAFYSCKKLSSVVLSYNIATIEAYAFAGCWKLERVVWDTRETHAPLTIGDYAFASCETLSQWTILQDTNVTAIGNYAFYNCDFSGILIPVTVTSIGDSAFEKCSILDNGGVVCYTGSESQWQEISIDSNNTELTTATICYNYTGD